MTDMRASAACHSGERCSASTRDVSARRSSALIPGGATSPRQLANSRSTPPSRSVGASIPGTRRADVTASTRSCPAWICSRNSPELETANAARPPSSAARRSPPPSNVR